MDNDTDLRECTREEPGTINVISSRENRNLQSAAVNDPVYQHPAGASNISNVHEIIEFQDHMLGAHMVQPNKICRICKRGWPDLWMPNVCNCSGKRSVVHPGCLQYHAVAKTTRRCSVCGVDQFSEREKEKGEDGKKEKREDAGQKKSDRCTFMKALCRFILDKENTLLVYIVIPFTLCFVFENLIKLKEQINFYIQK